MQNCKRNKMSACKNKWLEEGKTDAIFLSFISNNNYNFSQNFSLLTYLYFQSNSMLIAIYLFIFIYKYKEQW